MTLPLAFARLAGAFLCLSFAPRLPAAIPTPFNTEPAAGGPMPAAMAAAQVKLPPGFHCTVFAAEPDVCQPIAMTTDSRGRLWVAENYTYAERTVGFHPDLRDRILVFEDTDNDGRYDQRTVFWEGAQRLTSIEVGLGGVWALCPPNLYFIPDKNGDDVPDREPEIVLDGFEFTRARHTLANGLRWGPDGWLYGRQGILGTSRVGKPDTPPEQRTTVNTGIWRYHPRRGTFEIVAAGTTNPWGMDWNAQGEPFFINTVIGHLWHLIPGGHYRRMSGNDLNPHVYEIIEQHADHVHWATGEVWTDVRQGVSQNTLATGGGHAHTGLLIYQGGQWPAEWNGKLLTNNLHGRRINVERLEREGSGFVGKREPDEFVFTDPWLRAIDLIAAPDGGVFLSDWSDTGECHENDGVHRTSGRIYKIAYGEAKPRTVGDLARLSGTELARLQFSNNDWLARQSRRVLADRAAAGVSVAEAETELQRILAQRADPVARLRALWALYVINDGATLNLAKLLAEPDESMRVWAIRLAIDRAPVALDAGLLQTFIQLAKSDPSALVRLALASALQRLPAEQRARVAGPLLAHAEDATDHNLPLMLWYGIEPLAGAPQGAFEKLVIAARIPRVQRLAARRLAEDIDQAPARVDALLSGVATAAIEVRQAVLDGIAEALRGRRKAPKPAVWDALQASLAAGATDALRNRIRNLGALFGEGRATDELRAIALDDSAELAARRTAVQSLVDIRAPGLRDVCAQLLRIRGLAGAAAAGLALSDDPAVADLMLSAWPQVPGNDRPPVMSVLVSRPAWAAMVLDRLAAGKLQRVDLSGFHARQIRAFKDPVLTRRLDEVWGKTQDGSESEKTAALAKWRQLLAPDTLVGANPAKGRTHYAALCGACHTLNGEGGNIGPNLTGAARDNLEYLLENILFPSAVVPDDYRLTTLTLKDGRALAGMIRARTNKTLTLQTMTEQVALSLDDIVSQETSAVSLMPAGLLDGLELNQARDLVAYLMSMDTPGR
ncbi:MAG: c-type cytochrome [Opitutus sp.]|nr:c-type cytochrome [Opitutus sp.]